MKQAAKPDKTGAMPRTGRIGRFVKILETEVNADAFAAILQNADHYASLDAAGKSAWWKRAAEELERRVERDRAAGIMRRCGAMCCGKGQRNTAKRLFAASESLEDFLLKISTHGVKEGDLTYTLKDEHTIIAQYHRCFCSQVAHTKEPFESLMYCQCSVEFNKQFFTAALERDVHAELLQSIVCGAKSCKFRITF